MNDEDDWMWPRPSGKVYKAPQLVCFSSELKGLSAIRRLTLIVICGREARLAEQAK